MKEEMKMTTLNNTLVKDLSWQKLTLNAEEAGEYLKDFSQELPQFDLLTPKTFKDMEWGVQEVKPVAYVTRAAADLMTAAGITFSSHKTVIIDGIASPSIYLTHCFDWNASAVPAKKVRLESGNGFAKVIAFQQDTESKVIELTTKPKPKRPVRA
jgi:hypothetical protein